MKIVSDMHHLRGFSGIKYCPRIYNSHVDPQQSYFGRVYDAILYYVQYWTFYNDQICLTRRGMEVESTGVNREMIKRLCEERATKEEEIAVRKMLRSIIGRNLSKITANEIGFISKRLLKCPNLLNGVIMLKFRDKWNKLLASPKADCVLKTLEKYPELVLNDHLTPKLWDKILASPEADRVLRTLGKYSKLLENEQLIPELWDKILASPEADYVLKALGTYPEVLDNEQLTFELWDQLLSSNKPHKIIAFIKKHLSLLQDREIAMEVLVNLGGFPQFIDIVSKFGGLRELMKDAVLWEETLKSKNPSRVLGFFIEDRKYGKYITISPEGYSKRDSGEAKVYLNRNQFLNDETIDLWNVLIRRKDEIDEDYWDFVQTDLADVFDKVYQRRDNQRYQLFKFLEQCMETADAEKSWRGFQVVRKRVDAIVNVLKKYLEKTENPDLSKEEKERIEKMMIRPTLDIMAMGGSACPDNAIVFLRLAENHIKLFECPQYLPNIIVNMFKLDSITEMLIDKDNPENVESYLLYTFMLNDLLGLGVSGTMLYEEIGKIEPFEIALPKLSAHFTEENLIKFTVKLEEFRSFFEEEDKTLNETVEAKKEEYLDADEDYRCAKDYPNGPEAQEKLAITEKISKEIESIKNTFFHNKARQMFLDSGFFVTKGDKDRY